MRQLRANKTLGVAITADALLVAEIHGAAGRGELRRCAEFRYPEGTSTENLGGLGRPFGQFLRQQGFTARNIVVGLPANWVMARTKDLPPSDAHAAATLLRLQAETEFSVDLKELIFDYAGASDRALPRQVLLLAVPQARINQINELASAARLNVLAIMPSVAALAVISKTMLQPEGLLVYADSRTAELAFQNSRGLQRIRYAAVAGTPVPNASGSAATLAAGGPTGPQARVFTHELASELRRALASMPENGTPIGLRKLVFWDGSGQPNSPSTAISERVGMAMATPTLKDLGLRAPDSDRDSARCIAAIALALAGSGTEVLPVDFAHSRLAPPKRHAHQRLITVASILLAVLLLSAGYLIYDTERLHSDLNAHQARIAQLKPASDKAETAAKHLSFVNNWRGAGSPYVSCLYYLTQAFPDDGSAWAVSLDIQGNLTGQLQGKATNPNSPQVLADRLKHSGKFKDVKGPDWRSGDRANAREVSFSLTFTFIATE